MIAVSDVLLSLDVDVINVCAVCLLVAVIYADVAIDVVVVFVMLRLFDPFLPDVVVDSEEVDDKDEVERGLCSMYSMSIKMLLFADMYHNGVHVELADDDYNVTPPLSFKIGMIEKLKKVTT